MPTPDAHPHQPALSVYDLDGVVTRKDTFTQLLRERLGASPRLALKALPAIAAWTIHGLRPDARTRAAQRVAEVALAGLTEEEYVQFATAVGERIGADPSWLRVDVVDRVRREHGAGTRIVVATASEHHLAAALLRRAGVPFDLLSASQVVAGPAGLRIADHRIGARKAQALQAAGVRLDTAVFSTDSLTDLPTARRAAQVVLIGASRRTRARYAVAGIDVQVH